MGDSFSNAAIEYAEHADLIYIDYPWDKLHVCLNYINTVASKQVILVKAKCDQAEQICAAVPSRDFHVANIRHNTKDVMCVIAFTIVLRTVDLKWHVTPKVSRNDDLPPSITLTPSAPRMLMSAAYNSSINAESAELEDDDDDFVPAPKKDLGAVMQKKVDDI